jgi:hypothetical protein
LNVVHAGIAMMRDADVQVDDRFAIGDIRRQ